MKWWDSIRWKNGTTYEGTVAGEHLDGHGVLRYANGDKYEGQFTNRSVGSMSAQHGSGVYVWSDGDVRLSIIMTYFSDFYA